MFQPRHSTTLLRLCDGEGENADPRLRDLLDAYEEVYGPGDVWVVRVPARICLAADHTDYWRLFTPELLTFASDEYAMFAVIGPREDRRVRLFSMDGFDACEFSIEEAPVHHPEASEADWLEWLESNGAPNPFWSNYVAGIVQHCQLFHGVEYGFEMLVSSDIPPASGASSSSALTICAALAVRLCNGISLDEDALVSQTAMGEWFVGTRGGMMDHATMVHGGQDELLRLTFRPFSVEPLALPESFARHQFLTVFTHPSDKGRDVQIAFNARAMAAREVIPHLIGEAEDEVEGLPEEMTVQALSVRDARLVSRLRPLYPMLFESSEIILRLRDWGRFAHRERGRARRIEALLQDGGRPDQIGAIMDEAWQDAGGLYGIRTDRMDLVAATLRAIPGVEGVKVMGAGFGGNLLALVHEDRIQAVEAALSERRNILSKGVEESILIHRPGPGMLVLDPESLMPDIEMEGGLAAVLLCGGKGSRMQAEGIQTHKPLLELAGVPSTRRVVQDLLVCGLTFDQILIVVPPGREAEYSEALTGLPVEIHAQGRALGTGDAVHGILGELQPQIRHLYVSFGTQPLIRARTIRAGLSHHLARDLGFTLCTTWCANPYAPLVRDERGQVIGSVETHLDGAEMPAEGETNVGAYWADRKVVESVLSQLHAELFNTFENRYETGSGELGYPNEMVKACLAGNIPVDGAAYADPDELIGLKTPAHIPLIETRLRQREVWP